HRGYIDVGYTVPDGDQLDQASITDLGDEFTLAVGGSSHGTISLDDTQAPVFLGIDPTTHQYKFRYWVMSSGTVAQSDVTLTTIGSPVGWGLTTTTGTTIPGTAVTLVAMSLDTPYIDVALSPTQGQTVNAALDPTKVTFTDDHGAAITGLHISSAAPTQIPNTKIYRYYLTGTIPASGKIVVTFGDGAW